MTDKTSKPVACVVIRDFWDDEGKRHRAGSTVQLSQDVAMDGVEAGILRREKAQK